MENDEAVAARPLVLATAPERRSKSGRLRTLLPAIETSLRAGVSLEVILAELNKQGLEMNIGTFKSTLYRIRSKGKNPAAKAAKPTPKNEAVLGAHHVQQNARPSKNRPAPDGTKVGEPKRFEWDIERIKSQSGNF